MKILKNSIVGLDIDLISNFARKVNVEIEYIITNETLTEIFNDKYRTNTFLQSMNS